MCRFTIPNTELFVLQYLIFSSVHTGMCFSCTVRVCYMRSYYIVHMHSRGQQSMACTTSEEKEESHEENALKRAHTDTHSLAGTLETESHYLSSLKVGKSNTIIIHCAKSICFMCLSTTTFALQEIPLRSTFAASILSQTMNWKSASCYRRPFVQMRLLNLCCNPSNAL